MSIIDKLNDILITNEYKMLSLFVMIIVVFVSLIMLCRHLCKSDEFYYEEYDGVKKRSNDSYRTFPPLKIIRHETVDV